MRFTNKDVICQITYAKLKGDVVLTAAYSHELPRYGLEAGLTNYAATYATGLLAARRHLQKLKLDTKYVGKEVATGEYWTYKKEDLEDGPNPFRANLDVGLVRTSTGARVFAALKGAVDGGLDVPHSETRFAGYKAGEAKGEEGKLNTETLRKYLFGGHVSDYMKKLQAKDPERYKRQFSVYIAKGIKPEDMQALYATVHKNIRADPSSKKKEPKKLEGKPKRFNRKKKSLAEFKARVQQKKEAHLKKN